MVSAVDTRTGETGSSNNLSSRERTALGALGGLIVGIATYPVGETFGYAGLFIDGHAVEIVGFVLRILGTATLGAIWSYVHKPEHDPRRAFQLGIVAPAALAGVIYANTNDSEPAAFVLAPIDAPAIVAADSAPDARGLTLISSANAATVVQQKKPTKKPKPTFMERLIKGIVGK